VRNPGGTADTHNNHAADVWYDNAKRRWAIFRRTRRA
jgi:hypothetical protein